MKINKKSILCKIVTLVVFISTLAMSFPELCLASTTQTSIRLSGQTRYDTSGIIAENYEQGKVQNIVLSTGTGFADALSASVLAHRISAPILLVDTTVEQSQSAFDYITRHLDPTGTVYITGGTGVISKEFETKLYSLGFKYARFAGYDRYETSYQIANGVNNPSTVVIASGESFPDALSISSFAANNGWPILLTTKNVLPEVMKNFLTANTPSKIYIIGGTGVISGNVESQISSIAPQASIERLAGQDRFDTNTVIAQTFKPNPTTIYVATGNGFADALSGSSLAAKSGDPILLIDSTSATPPTAIANYLKKLESSTKPNLVVFGGTAVVPDSVLTNMNNLMLGTEDIVKYEGKSNFVPVANQSEFSVSDTSKDLANKYGLKWYEDPTKSVSKGQAMLFQLRTIQASLRRQGSSELNANNQTLDNFVDKDSLVASVQEEAKVLKYLGGLSNDNDVRLDFKEYMTRAELAKFLTNVNESYLKITTQRTDVVFNDTIQHAAKEYISYAYQIGLMDGISDLFYPDNGISIEQLIEIMDNESGNHGITAKDIAVAMNETFKVTVNVKATEILPEHSSYSVKMNEEAQIKVTVAPTTNEDFEFVSNDASVCQVTSVDQNLDTVTIKGLKLGLTYVTVSLKDDPSSSVIIPVSVTEEVTTPVDEVTTPVDEVTTPVDEVTTPVDEVTTPVDEVIIPVDEVTVSKVTSQIKFSDKIDGATQLFASVTLSSAAEATIESNVEYEVQKISDTIYYVSMSVEDGSHGTVCVSVNGSNIELNEGTINY